MTGLTPSTANSVNDAAKRRLAVLLSVRSKHSTYQELHPWVLQVLGPSYSPSGKCETLRWEYMSGRLDFHNTSVLDIGANTGYFSFAALAMGAFIVEAFEGNQWHAAFIQEIAAFLNIAPRLVVVSDYFDFEAPPSRPVDIVLCLNVLHHLGDDFSNLDQTLVIAKRQMAGKLSQLAKCTHYCWFQMGFNWKGDRNQPLFENGLKAELIDFVRYACGGAWTIENVALYDPAAGQYASASDALLQRFDALGEFLNRPLFLLRSNSYKGSGSHRQEANLLAI